jgi:CDP-glucose 4,6-dehydratase
LDSKFWGGKRVFVTGHTGFKGAWLCLLLKELGAEVWGYALAPPTEPSLFKLARIDELVSSTEGDVRDLNPLTSALQACAPDVVIHLAAQALVRASYREPAATYATNVMGTVHLLEGVRQAGGVRVVLNVTSDKCYRNVETLRGYQEDQPMGGHDPYSSSKGCAELVTEAYRNSYFSNPAIAAARVALASARAGNVIGGGDWAADRLIPDIVRCCALGHQVEIRNPGAIRPWQHVLEPLSGYLQLAERLWDSPVEFAQGWNFGPQESDAQPVHAIVQRITSLWGEGASWRLSGDRHPHEAKYLKLDCTKARVKLGWRPRTDLDTALQWTVEWYKDHRQGADARGLCQQQIRNFSSGEGKSRWEFPNAGFAKAS